MFDAIVEIGKAEAIHFALQPDASGKGETLYAIRTKSDKAWMSAKEALVLYGQTYKVVRKNAAWLAIIVYGFSFLMFIVTLAPAGLVV